MLIQHLQNLDTAEIIFVGTMYEYLKSILNVLILWCSSAMINID